MVIWSKFHDFRSIYHNFERKSNASLTCNAAHFALTKWTEQEMVVPEGAPRYWWKRILPPLEFGSMHAILFQMALIPLSMSRYSISALSGSIMNRFVPLNRAVRIHIHLGYVMVCIVFLAVITVKMDQVFCIVLFLSPDAFPPVSPAIVSPPFRA